MTGNLPFCTVLIFCQASVRSSVRGVGALGDDAFPVQSGGVLKHLLPVSDEVFGVDHGRSDTVFIEEVSQGLFALDLGELTEVAVAPEKVEGVEDQSVLSARGEASLEFGEVGAALVDDNHLPIDDGLAGHIEGAGDGGKPPYPIMAVAGEGSLLPAVQIELDAVAVEFNLVNPPVAPGCRGLQGGELGFNEPRHLDFATHNATRKRPRDRSGEKRRTRPV
jgi:hypothetical protein